METIDRLIGQDEQLIESIYGSVRKVKFNEKMSKKSVDLVRIHLGYLKNFATLTNIRFTYNRHARITGQNTLSPAKGGARTRRKKA